MSVSAMVGKPPVHTAGRRGGPFGVDIAQGVDKGENTVFVVLENWSCNRPVLHHRKPMAARLAKTQGEDGR